MFFDNKVVRELASQIKIKDCSKKAIKYVDDFYNKPTIPAYEIENRKSSDLNLKTALLEIVKALDVY